MKYLLTSLFMVSFLLSSKMVFFFKFSIIDITEMKWVNYDNSFLGRAKTYSVRIKTDHGMFLEWWNTTKSISTIWQRFSCLLEIESKKLKSHGGLLSYLQDRTANLANLAAIFCPALVCPQTAIVGIKVLAYFCSPFVK